MRQHIGIGLVILFAVSAIPLSLSAQTPPLTVQLQTLIDQYEAGSALVRPTLARQIERASRRVPAGPETAYLRTQALIVLSKQAASERRKDTALKHARLATTLSAGVVGADAQSVRARAAIATAHALILRQDFVAAMTTVIAARRAYGPMVGESDVVWDELLLWTTLAQSSAPERLHVQIDAVNMPDEEAFALNGPKGELCSQSAIGIERNPSVGREPVYPVISWFSDLQGGVIMRSQIAFDGKVISSRATAFAPTEGFAAAAENALPTWTYKVPADLPAICRENFLTILAFKIG